MPTPTLIATPRAIAAGLSVPARMLLFCVASGTDYTKAGVVNGASVQLAMVRGLVRRDEATAQLTLTARGRAVLAALVQG